MRSAGFIVGWLGAVLAVVGSGCAKKPAGTFDEADVHAWLEEWRDARQTADRLKRCALRSRDFVVFYTQAPRVPGEQPIRSENNGEMLCKYGGSNLLMKVELLAANITMLNGGRNARVTADFRQSTRDGTPIFDSHILFVLGEEAGKLVSLREDMTFRFRETPK